jgi:hypothetical protein
MHFPLLTSIVYLDLQSRPRPPSRSCKAPAYSLESVLIPLISPKTLALTSLGCVRSLRCDSRKLTYAVAYVGWFGVEWSHEQTSGLRSRVYQPRQTSWALSMTVKMPTSLHLRVEACLTSRARLLLSFRRREDWLICFDTFYAPLGYREDHIML